VTGGEVAAAALEMNTIAAIANVARIIPPVFIILSFWGGENQQILLTVSDNFRNIALR
jgi:hypothetical protein